MIKYKPFDIVIIPFPFSNLNTKKQRPALILSANSQKSAKTLYICSMITSQIEGETLSGDVLLKDWKAAKLLHLSKVRLSKIVTIEESLIKKELGKLTRKDQNLIKKGFKQVFKDILKRHS